MQRRLLRITIATVGMALMLAWAVLPVWSMAPAEDAPQSGGGDYEIRGRIREDGVDLPGITVTLAYSLNPDTIIQTVTTGSDGRYTFTDVADGGYLVRPEHPAYEFNPPQRNVLILFGDASNIDFTAIFREYDVDGRVMDNGSGLPNIIVRIYELPNTTTPVGNGVTDTQGHYLFPDMVPGSYRVRPEHIDYTFVPAFRDLTVSTGPVTAPDIEANINLYAASGHVSDNGAELGGVSLTLAPVSDPDTILQTVGTNAGGDYIFTGVEPGSYRVTPTMEDYLFVPDYRDILVSGGDTENVNFEANINVFSVRGTVDDDGVPLSGVQMTLTETGNPDPVGFAVTDSNGEYEFPGVDPGSYRVTPSRGGYAFVPPARDFTVSNSDVNNLNFEANVLTYNATGNVQDNGEGLAGVTIQLFLVTNPNPIAEVVTDEDGNFAFESLSPNEYRVAPVLEHYSFVPPERVFSIISGNAPNLNFEANTSALHLPMLLRGAGSPPPPTPTPSPTAIPCVMEVEPNSLADADANGNFAPGVCINGRIPDGDANDFYRVQFPGGTFNASLTNIPAGTDYDLTLWRVVNGVPELVAVSNNQGTQNENIQHGNLAAGVYYMAVQRFAGNSDALYRVIWSVGTEDG